MTIPLATVPPSWRTPKDAPDPTGEADVFVLCRRAHLAQVRKRIQLFASKPYGDLKEPTRLANTLRPESEYDGNIQGWLEMTNGFMFFTSRQMWEQTCALFGVETAEVPA